MTLINLSTEEFENFAKSVEIRYFEQSDSMYYLLTKRGYETELIGYLDKNNEIQVASVVYSASVAGGKYMQIHYGPLYQDETYLEPFLNSLKEYAKEKKALELVVKPYYRYQYFDDHGNPISEKRNNLEVYFKNAGFDYQGLTEGYKEADWHYVKNLTGITEKELINSFSKKGKPLVKKAKSFGIKIKKLKRDELHIFKEITSSTSDRRSYDDKPLEYYEFLFDSFKDRAEFLVATLNFRDYYNNLERDQSKLRTKLDKLEQELEVNPNSEKKKNQYKEFSSQFQTFEVRKDEAQNFIAKYGDQDVILAGSIFVFMEQEATYLFSGSYSEFNKFYAPTILQEYVMLEAIKRGIKRYNLLGISGFFDGSDGVLGFKQNFNGIIERNYGAFNYYPFPLKKKMIEKVKKILKRN